ncbi:hypothetical protein AAF712_015701 [Marasmius tenuissimus]|uniref:NACHT domain-containing protein n=1 Tax=Marasmius tenuissimus TaxID=585030 RepID=A0ABR2Z8P0_9AGAR
MPHQLATAPVFRKAGLSSSIDAAVRENTKGLQNSNLEGQFQSLIFQPCTQIDKNGWKTLPRLVVIDGLDECMGGSGTTGATDAQETLLSIIHRATSAEPPLPLRFMIFSRPELTIRHFFRTIMVSHEPVDIRDFRAGADDDIKRFLNKQFDDIVKAHPEILAGSVWPREEETNKLVHKADGHFIFVVTAMKFIASNSPSLVNLQERLDVVLHTEETTSHPDLSDLDQLYHTILRRFSNGDLGVLLPILQLIITPHPRVVKLDAPRGRSRCLIATFLGIDFDQCSALLFQLRSVLHVPDDAKNEDVSILHASFLDFLGERRRSHEFHVQPLSTLSYLDLFSCCLISILSRKVDHHRRREWMDPGDQGLELWSLNPWSMVQALTTQPARNHTPSERLISAVIGFNVYGYLNMILDRLVP